MISFILAILCGACLLGLDQYTKIYISNNFVEGTTSGFIKLFNRDLIDITFIHNDGGAWGLLAGHTWVLLSATIITMLICIALLLKEGTKNKLMFWAITLVMFGGLGNMIDRIFRGGEVVDFLHFSFWQSFPVFNVADCGVVVGAGLLVLYFVLSIIKEAKGKQQADSTEPVENNDE